MAGSSDVLSQSEIDSLLNALSAGEVNAEEIKSEEKQKKVKIYDFKRPDKFSKDQIRTLSMLHENFARLLNTYLSTHLRTIVQVDVASVDQLTYEEFTRSLPNPSIISIFEMSPLKGNVILEINPNIVFPIIDRLFGGAGQGLTKPRGLTDIEEVIVLRVLKKALESFQEAWKQVLSVEVRMDALETNPQFTQIVPPNDMVVLITLQARIGVSEGFINVCIPYLVLEPIMSKLSTTYWVASKMNREGSAENILTIRRKLEKTTVPLSVQLGTASITVGELLSLQQNDVLPLDTKVDSELKLIVGSKGKFYCKPGLSGSKIAVQITDVAKEGEEE